MLEEKNKCKKRKGKVREGKKEKFPKPAKRSEAALILVLFQLPPGVFKGHSQAFFQGGMVEASARSHQE